MAITVTLVSRMLMGLSGGIAQQTRDADIGAGEPVAVEALDQVGAGPHILEAAAGVEARKDRGAGLGRR